MMAHTPGPWHATNHFADDSTPCNCASVLSDGYAGSVCQVSFDNGRSIADGGNDAPPRDEAAANARLIAAAPELLAVCEAMIPSNVSLSNDRWPDSTVVPLEVTLGELRAVRAVISKATGAA